MELKKIRDYIGTFDFFGAPIPLNINKNNSYTTALGGFASLFIIGLMILFFQSNVISFLGKTIINTEVTTVFSNDPDEILFNGKNSAFAVSIQQPANNYATRPTLNITMLQRHYKRLDNGTQVRKQSYIQLMPCTLDQFQNLFSPYNINISTQFNQLGFAQWLCPTPDQNISLQGLYGSEYFNFVKIQVTPCKNNSNSNSFLKWQPACASPEEIDKLFAQNNNFQIQFYMVNNVVNPGDPTNFVQPYISSEVHSTFTPRQILKSTDVYFKKYVFATDQSLFPMKDIENSEYYIKDVNDWREDVVQGQKNDTVFAEYFMRRSQFTVYVNRSFQKIDDLLSYLGGFVQFVIVLFGIVVGYYNKYQLMTDLSNNLYDFKLKDESKEKNPKINVSDKAQANNNIFSPNMSQGKLPLGDQTQRERISNIEIGSNPDSNVQEYKSQQEYLVSRFRNIIKNKKPIYFSWRFLWAQLFCGKFGNTETKLLGKAFQKVSEDLDVYGMLCKLQEVEKLKHLLLEKEQIIIFNFHPKPVISEEEKDQLPSRYTFEKKQTLKHGKNLTMETTSQNKSNFSRMIQIQREHDIKMYQRLYSAYVRIRQRLSAHELNPAELRINMTLIEELGEELQDIFENSRHVDIQIENPAGNTVHFSTNPKGQPILQAQDLQKSQRDVESYFDIVSVDRDEHYISAERRLEQSNNRNETSRPGQKP